MSESIFIKRRRTTFIAFAVLLGIIVSVALFQLNQTGAAILTPIPTPPQQVFYDDLSGDLSRWTVVSGTWAIEGGELSGDNNAGTAEYKIMTLASFSGYRLLEAKVVFKGWYVSPHGSAYQRAGIIIQKNPSSIYHDWCLVIRGDNRLSLLSEGITWGPSFSFTPVVDTAYRMKMMYDGTEIKGKCWVDGETEPDWQLSAEWTDTVSDARIGLYAAYAHAHFDDVRVSGRSETDAYSVDVRAGVRNIIVTCTWTGTGNITILNFTSPVRTYYESDMSIYEKTKVTVNNTATSIFNIRRCELSIAPPTTKENWTLYLSLSDVTSYQVSVETSQS